MLFVQAFQSLGLPYGVAWFLSQAIVILMLSVSLLVIVLGAVLVPALSLRDALIAIVVGAVAGNLLLGLAGLIGADARVPGMVVLRAPLGRTAGQFVSRPRSVALTVANSAPAAWKDFRATCARTKLSIKSLRRSASPVTRSTISFSWAWASRWRISKT